jgi:acetyltransferase-like isoleucine patch superfamily enzyme
MVLYFLINQVRKVLIIFRYYLFKLIYSTDLCLGSRIIFGSNFSISLVRNSSKIILGDNVEFRSNVSLRLSQNAKLQVGNNVFFNNSCSINCLSNILIGSNCQFGEGVKFYDHNHNYGDKSRLVREQGYSIERIIIGDNCWFGSNVIILKGVNVGDNVVIGAGCVIYKSIPSGSVIINKQQLLTL